MTNSQRGLPAPNPGRAGDGQVILGPPLSTSGFPSPPTLLTNRTGCSTPQDIPQPRLLVLQINPPNPGVPGFLPLLLDFSLWVCIHLFLWVQIFQAILIPWGFSSSYCELTKQEKVYLFLFIQCRMFCAGISTRFPLPSYPYSRFHGAGCTIFAGKIAWTLQNLGFPGGAVVKTCQCGRHKRCRFDPWVGKIPWRRKWQPTPVFLPGKSNGQRSLAGYSPWGYKESDTKHRVTKRKCFRV